MAYVIGIDQSTQGTKVLLFDGNGNIMYRADRPHRQIINDRGWVSHDMEEVYANLINGVRELLEQTGVDDKKIAAVGISNQRETTVAWGKDGKPLAPAVVWQCGRAKGMVEELERRIRDWRGRSVRLPDCPCPPIFPRQRWHGCFARRERPFIWERWTAILSTV